MLTVVSRSQGQLTGHISVVAIADSHSLYSFLYIFSRVKGGGKSCAKPIKRRCKSNQEKERDWVSKREERYEQER